MYIYISLSLSFFFISSSPFARAIHEFFRYSSSVINNYWLRGGNRKADGTCERKSRHDYCIAPKQYRRITIDHFGTIIIRTSRSNDRDIPREYLALEREDRRLQLRDMINGQHI